MPPFLSLARARSFCLLHALFRIDTEDQPHRHLVAICQLQNYARDLSRIAFRTPLKSSQHPVYRTDRGLVVRQQVRHILTRAPGPVGPNASRLQRADLDPERCHYAALTEEHWQSALNLNFMAAVRCKQALS